MTAAETRAVLLCGEIMEKVITATGKKFDCDYFNPSTVFNQTNLRVLNESIANVAVTFSDPNETIQLWCGTTYASHYTKLVAIVPENDAIRIVLGKE